MEPNPLSSEQRQIVAFGAKYIKPTDEDKLFGTYVVRALTGFNKDPTKKMALKDSIRLCIINAHTDTVEQPPQKSTVVNDDLETDEIYLEEYTEDDETDDPS